MYNLFLYVFYKIAQKGMEQLLFFNTYLPETLKILFAVTYLRSLSDICCQIM